MASISLDDDDVREDPRGPQEHRLPDPISPSGKVERDHEKERDCEELIVSSCIVRDFG
jgi:hypothetical protein